MFKVLLPLLLAVPALFGQTQPVPYSHKTHVGLGLKCNSCHKNADPGEMMGFPATSFCMLDVNAENSLFSVSNCI